MEEISEVGGINLVRDPVCEEERSLELFTTSTSMGGAREERFNSLNGTGSAVSMTLLSPLPPIDILLVYEGFRSVPSSVILTASFFFVPGVTRTRIFGLAFGFAPAFPRSSKYSISKEGCETPETLVSPRNLWVGIVSGLPSSGMEYEVRSVRRDMSVARSVGAKTLPLSVQDTSVGAGKGGLLVSGIPIVLAQRL